MRERWRFFGPIFREGLLVLLFILLPSYLPAATFTVNSTLDAVDASLGDGNCADAGGNCTLRAAVQETNTLSTDDVIILPAGTYTLTLAAETVSPFRDASKGDLDIGSANCFSASGNLTLTGAGSGVTVIDGGYTTPLSAAACGTDVCGTKDRIFQIDSCFDGITVVMSGLTIQNGCAAQQGGGGGLINDADDSSGNGGLTLDDVVITNNKSELSGGGILSEANLTMTNSVVSDNTVLCDAAGIDYLPVSSTNVMSLTRVTISGNSSVGNNSDFVGGGIYIVGQAILDQVTVSGNSATYGGGLYDQSGGCFPVGAPPSSFFTNVTVSGNSATKDGGGIYLSCSRLESNNVTVANNTADSDSNGTGNGGGIFVANGDILDFRNTLIGGNIDTGSQAPDCTHSGTGTLSSFGYNFIQDTTGCTISGDTTGNITGQNPLLEALALNAPGTTETHALQAGSPAIDAGDPAGCTDGTNPIATDQRGIPRPVDGNGDFDRRCDIGAYEAEGCGDQIVQSGEACDDANLDNTDACVNTCQFAACGDGFLQDVNNEECEDGNSVSNDGCSGTCLIEFCGDQIINNGGETCDDGNTLPGDGCDADCQTEPQNAPPSSPLCGNGIVESGETCDDGNTVDTDACKNDCSGSGSEAPLEPEPKDTREEEWLDMRGGGLNCQLNRGASPFTLPSLWIFLLPLGLILAARRRGNDDFKS